jgi:predicted CopG family antitoxin
MNTTISISKEVRDKIKEFGHKGETYEVILERLYNSAKERQLQDLLMDDSDCITLKEAKKKLAK